MIKILTVCKTTKHHSQHIIGANVHTLLEFKTSKSIYSYMFKIKTGIVGFFVGTLN